MRWLLPHVALSCWVALLDGAAAMRPFVHIGSELYLTTLSVQADSAPRAAGMCQGGGNTAALQEAWRCGGAREGGPLRQSPDADAVRPPHAHVPAAVLRAACRAQVIAEGQPMSF